MDTRNLDNVKSCPHCKGFFISVTDDVCSSKICIQKENDLIKILDNYLTVNKNASIKDILENTNLKMDFLKRFMNRSTTNFILTKEEEFEKEEQSKLLEDLKNIKKGRNL